MDERPVEITGAENVHWNLDDLFPSSQELDDGLSQAESSAAAFAQEYRGRVAQMGAAQLAQALKAMEELLDLSGRAYTYAYLNWSTDTNDPTRGALLQKVREAYNRISQQILFFDLEWIAVDDESAEALMQTEQLSGYVHHLRLQRLSKPYVLSEPEERIMIEKSITGASAWMRFFDETMGAARFRFREQEMTEQEVLSKLHDPDRDVRRDAAMSLTDGLRERQRETTFIFNTLLAEKASNDRLRGYKNWLASRNLSNQVADEAVESLIQAVSGRSDLVARFYRLKRKLLGLDELWDYDRYSPIEQADTRYSWNQARDIVLESYGRFHPRMSDVASKFFEKRWIDAPVRPGKRGGAFSHSAVPSCHPYVMLNYTGLVRDVQTLAHELGHGVHQYLARGQGPLQCDTPLTTAETASVFGEMLVFENLLNQEQDPRNRLAMLMAKIDDTTATVFRQIAMNRFEDRVHNARRSDGELSTERLCEMWMETQSGMFEGSVRLGGHYSIWWSYIPHFLHSPGYVYAYAFGELLVLALFARYREEGESFAPKYLDLLASGGSDWPNLQVAKLGIDLTDPGFWHQGLAAIEDIIGQAETLAQRANGQPA